MCRWYARAAIGPAMKPLDWQKSNRIFLATFVGLLAAVYIFIVLIDPYGVVPFSLPFQRPIMSSQRQMYPQILRTGRYDSIVVGTSTSRFLDPLALGRVLHGHFANFAMPSSTAREQIEIIRYFRRTVAVPNVLLVGLDHEWCYRNSSAYEREKEFPSWAYDGNRWNDLLYLLNSPTLEVAVHTFGWMLGRYPERMRGDGFAGDSPSESIYDIARARHAIYSGEPGAVRQVMELSEAEPNATRLEALPWLDQALAELPDTTRKFLVFPPVHAHALPTAGSRREALDAECKTRVAMIARRRGAMLVDWRRVSPLTTDDSHFWDLVHYRLPIAYQLIDDLDHIVAEGRESPDGSYRVLVP
jgi:hypothetical protein